MQAKLRALTFHLSQEEARISQFVLESMETKEPDLGDIPAGIYERVIAFSDIHGDLELLVNLLENTSRVIQIQPTGRIEWIGGEKVAIVIVGDIIDRHRIHGLSERGEFVEEGKDM